MSIQIDIVSDLHIDHWDKNYNTKYPYGNIKNYPLKFTNTDSDYLIIAGDISDDLENSIEYMNKISKYYKNILFIDGNHEHVNNYPNLYSQDYISDKIKNEKIKYLPNKPFVIDKTVFIGYCGWWDYNEGLNKDDCYDYFKDWIDLSKEDSLKFIENVFEKSKEEYNYLKKQLEYYQNKKNIENIIVITHTVPCIKYCGRNMHEQIKKFLTDYNTQYMKLFQYTKISHWIFGHTHYNWDEDINGIKFICNSRGIPSDMNREKYSIKKIEL